MKIAFCDDDLSILNEVHILIDKYRVERNLDVQYAAFQSPLELLAQIEKGMRFDILFLDVIMPGENGIEAAREIRKYDNNVKIIFLTSSAEFAVQSYTVGAYFYQLKPIWEESFFRLMDVSVSDCKKEQQNCLILRCKTGIVRVELERLEYCEVIGRTVQFHMQGGTVLERIGSLDEVWGQLMPFEHFLRPHRSYIVNMDYIQTMSYKAIVMSDGQQIPLPRGKYSECKDKYLEYVFSRKQVLL